MNKTSNEPDFSSIITQVAKDDGTSRPIPLTNTVVTSGMSQTTNGAKPRSTQKRRVLSFLLCCLNASNRNRSKGPAYSPTNDASANHELTALTCEKHAHLESTDKCLLPAIRQGERVKICLVIDLDETLVHSSFKPVPNADFIVPVEIDGQVHQVYVTKRPHVDEFLRRVGELYECVLFTASLAKYADPVADLLDPNHVFNVRLFRESCTYYNGNYIKDLSRLGRDIRKVIIIDNSPVSYIFHQDNAVPVTSWFDDMHDTELLALIPIFERLTSADDVVPALKDIHRRRPMI